MDFKERLDTPKSVEQLSERERTKRLHHQLSLVYDRVFITGDWSGEHPSALNEELAEDIATNIFENEPQTDPAVLADGIHDFIRDVVQTVPVGMGHEDLMTEKGRHDFNRVLGLKVFSLIRDILKQSVKDVGSDDAVRMAKAIDENIHYFRDIEI